MSLGLILANTKNRLKQLSPWFLAARPKTLPISFIPLLMGTFLAWSDSHQINWFIALIALLCSICIQIGTNLVNDALDFKKGSDTHDRIGSKRITQSGLLTARQVLQGGCICFGLALFLGIPLIIKGGIPLLVLIIVSIICGYIYTGGPYPLAYHGLGEVFVFLFYGLVSTCTAYYLQRGFIPSETLLAGSQIGLLACVPIAINNLRDLTSDARVDKRTLAVRFGKLAARVEISFFILFPYFLGLAWFVKGNFLMALLPLATLPLAVRSAKLIWNVEPCRQYNHFLAKSVLTMVLFNLLMLTGLIHESRF